MHDSGRAGPIVAGFRQRAFETLAAGALGAEVLFIVVVIGAAVFYVRPMDFVTVVRSPEMRAAMGLSLVTVTITTAVSVCLAIPAAYALTRPRVPLRGLIDTVLDLPIVMPPIAAGMALLVLFGHYLGDAMRRNGCYLPHSPAGIVVAQFFTTMTFAVRSAKAAFDGVSPRLPQVARTLGSSEWSAFRRVTLPLARPGLVAGIVLTWSRCLGLFGPVVMFCGATAFRTRVMPTAVYVSTSVGKLEEAVAASLILVAFALVALLIFKRLGGRGYLW